MRDIPLRVYEFAYDSVAGRRQLGVIGHELESMLPDSVEIKQQSFRNPDAKVGGPNTHRHDHLTRPCPPLSSLGHPLPPTAAHRRPPSALPSDTQTQKSQPLVKLQNFPVVDKNVLFMHNVGATQALLEKEQELAIKAAKLEEMEAEQASMLIALEERLKLEVEDQVGRVGRCARVDGSIDGSMGRWVVDECTRV